MPYSSISELPAQVRDNASEACQRIYREVYNSVEESEEGVEEGEIHQRAWGVMTNQCSRASEDEQYTKDTSGNAMQLKVLTNEVEPRTEVEDGTEYTVIPIRFIKSTDLHRGYVPEKEIQDATLDWNGTAIVSDHPVDSNGRLTLVADEDSNKQSIGEIREPRTIVTNDVVTAGEAWIDESLVADEADEAVVAAIKNKDTLSVSSAYQGERLPAGEYDGEYRKKVRGNLKPDHVAIFESKEGRCSIEDGCFVGPNADLSDENVLVNVTPAAADGDTVTTDDSGDSDEEMTVNREAARTPEFSGTTTGEWSAPTFSDYASAFGFDASSVSDLTGEQQTRIAETTLLGDAGGETFDELQTFPVVEPSTMNLSLRALRAVLGGRGAQADVSSSALESARTRAESLIDSNFDVDSNVTLRDRVVGILESLGIKNTTMSKTETLVNDHGFERDNLPSEETECFDRIYETFTANEADEEGQNDDGDGGDGGDGSGGNGDGSDDTDPQPVEQSVEQSGADYDAVLSKLDSMEEQQMTRDDVETVVEETLAANETRNEKRDLVDTLVNSGEYDADDREDLMEYPERALSDLVDNIDSPATDYSALRGASANAGAQDSDADSWPSLVANERIAEMEGDD